MWPKLRMAPTITKGVRAAENIVENFVTKVLEQGPYQELDRQYLVNRIYALVGETDPQLENIPVIF